MVGSVLVFVAAAWGVLVEGTVLRSLVASAIGAQLRATCTIDDFHWNGWNRAEIRGLSIRVKGWPDVASEVVSIAEMSAGLDPIPLLWGSLVLTEVSVDRMTVRAIERGDERRLNLFDLHLPADGASASRAPRITIRDLALHAGVLDERETVVHYERRHDLVGGISNDAHGAWHLSLSQRSESGAAPATIEGTLSGADLEYSLTLRNLELDDSLPRLLPLGVRALWEEMKVGGRVDSVTLAGNRGQAVREARVRVSGVTVTLPDIGMDEIWARYTHGSIDRETSSPRIDVQSGELEFRDSMLVLRELRGALTSADESAQVVPLPVSLSFWLDLDRGATRTRSEETMREWVESALEHAPFGLQLQVEDFTMRELDGVAPTIELPRLAAEILHNFQFRQGRVSIDAIVTRDGPHWRGGAPRMGEPLEGPIASEIQVRGALRIHEGEGAYFRFPYPLREVEAQISFDNDFVRVERLRGRGSGASEILVSGTVFAPGEDAGIDLRISTAQAPIDDVLEHSLDGSPVQRFLSFFFSRTAFDSLRNAGLFDAEVSRLRALREAVLAPLPEPGSRRDGDPDRAAALRRIESIDWLSNFHPGGLCAFDLRVRREVGGGDLIETTGQLELLEADALCEPLPYPIHVLGRDAVGAAAATIRVEDERIVLPDGGLRIRLPGGGRGAIRGSIDLPRTEGSARLVAPQLTVITENDAINDLLLAAIPAGDPNGTTPGPANGWPGARRSDAAVVLADIGFEGELDSALEVGGDGRGGVTWRLRLELSNGRARPMRRLAPDAGDTGLDRPRGFDLDRCRALVAVDESVARLIEFEGRVGEGRIRASGSVDLDTLDRDLAIDMEDIAADEFLIDLLPGAERERARAFWSTHEPAGAFDATMRWARDDDDLGAAPEFVVRPRWFAFTTAPPAAEPAIPRQRVRFTRREGEVSISGATAFARGLHLSIDEPGLPPSTLLVDGLLAAPHPATGERLRAEWRDADLASAVLLEVLSFVGADEAIRLWTDLRPSGRFDAEFGLASPGAGEARRARAAARFRRIDATVDGEAVGIEVDPSSSPVVFEPPFLRLPDLRAMTTNGRVALRGSLPLEPGAATGEPLFISYDGDRLGRPELALLGAGARRAAESIDLRCDGPVRMRDGELTFASVDGSLAPGFRGEVSFRDASFRAGLPFTEAAGRVTIGVPASGGADIRFDADSVRVLDHLLSDAHGRVAVAPGAASIRADPVTGRIAGGSVSATALVNLGPGAAGDGDYRLSVSLVGAQLSRIPATPTDPGPATGRRRADGRIDASMQIGGMLQAPWRRTGRGQVVIRHGRMAELPITLALLQVAQLMLPLSTALESGDIRFHVDGDRVAFERFDLTCPMLEFRGSGDLDLERDALSLRFRTRGTVPLWSDLLGALSETLFAIDVTGSIASPKVSVAPLPPLGRSPSARDGANRSP